MVEKHLSMQISLRVRIFLAIIFLIIFILLFYIQNQYEIQSISDIVRNRIFPKTTMSSSSSSSSIRCIVYLEERRGRLGNRMFMIASAYGLARIHDCHLCFSTEIIEEMRKIFVFDLPPFFLSQIMLNSSIDNGSEPWIRISRFIGCEYVTELVRPDAIRQGYIFELRGFWQSYLYFAKHINEFREHIFAGAQPVVQKVSQFFIHLYQKQFRIKPDLSNSVYKTLKQ
jgi:hypothetical protein